MKKDTMLILGLAGVATLLGGAVLARQAGAAPAYAPAPARPTNQLPPAGAPPASYYGYSLPGAANPDLQWAGVGVQAAGALPGLVTGLENIFGGSTPSYQPSGQSFNVGYTPEGETYATGSTYDSF